MVADFTGQRSGVYYEAGFAQGLGLPVIWLIDQQDFNSVKDNFDTRQYFYLVYETSEDLRKRLKNKIAATIGQGPLDFSGEA